MNPRTAAIAACGLLLLLLAAGRCSAEVRLITDPEAAARGELIRAAAAATGTAIAAHAAGEPTIAAANAQAIATQSANAAIVDDAQTRERLEVSARWTALQQAALTIGNYALLAIISAAGLAITVALLALGWAAVGRARIAARWLPIRRVEGYYPALIGDHGRVMLETGEQRRFGVEADPHPALIESERAVRLRIGAEE